MRHLVFDTETTNLVANSEQPITKQPQIIEFFALVLDQDLEEIDKHHQYFKPNLPIAPLITKITGITDAMVADAPRFVDECSAIEVLINSSDVVVAHNLSYDIAMCNFEFKRAGCSVRWPKKRVCTVEATEHLKGYRLNLGALHLELFGEAFENAHRAENDVRALARCYIELVKRGEI